MATTTQSSTPPLPADLIEKIAKAHFLPGRPNERFGEHHTIKELLELNSRRYAQNTFLTYLAEDNSARTYTYEQFHLQALRIAAVLSQRMGLKRGDRIATAMHNHDLAILIAFAAWHLGISIAPLNMGEEDKRLAYVLHHSGAKVLFTLAEYAGRMREVCKSISNIQYFVCADKPDAGFAIAEPREIDLASLLLSADFAIVKIVQPLFEPEPDDEALVVYTSGTTGVPKGVAVSQYNLIADAYAITRWHKMTPQTRLMCVLPVHHVNGLVVTHVSPFYAGVSVVLNRKFSVHNFFGIIAKYGVHIASVVPTLLQFLLEATPKDLNVRTLAPSLRYLICGAGPLTVELAARFEERFGIPICHGYGLSESTCYSCFMPLARDAADAEHKHWMREHGFPSIGNAVETNEMAVHDESGQEMAEGAKGEIVIRGHNIMLGYHDNLTANAAAFTHGWFRSGDEGFYKTGSDGKRYFFISGRFKELIIRGGVKISPLEIDEVLNRIAGVKAAMAVGFDNATYGEEVGAYVVLQPGAQLSAESILCACHSKLPFWMSPKVVIFGDTFPVTSTGKYMRSQLRPLFGAWREVQFKPNADRA